jgi:transketolase
MASGSVSLIVAAGELLTGRGFLCAWSLSQAGAFHGRTKHIGKNPARHDQRAWLSKRVSSGLASLGGGCRKIISVERFGASAPYKTIFEHYGLTVAAVNRLLNHCFKRIE